LGNEKFVSVNRWSDESKLLRRVVTVEGGWRDVRRDVKWEP